MVVIYIYKEKEKEKDAAGWSFSNYVTHTRSQ
jgi:hypothetical protein